MFSDSKNKKIFTYRFNKNFHNSIIQNNHSNISTRYFFSHNDKKKNNKHFLKKTYNLKHLLGSVFGLKDVAMGIVFFFAVYIGLKEYSVSVVQIPSLLFKPTKLNEITRDEFYLCFFELWHSLCFLVFGIRCLITNFCKSKYFLMFTDAVSSIIMLLPVAINLINDFSIQSVLTNLMFLIMWIFLFLQRIMLSYK